MKRVRILAVLLAIAFILLSGGQAFAAMTPEQQALYDEWYLARFGRLPASSPAAPTQPETPQQPTTPPASSPSKGKIAPVEASAFEQEILRLINQERVKIGLKPLKMNPYVAAVARVKAEDMIQNNYYAHGSSYGYSGTMLSYFGVSVSLSRENICQATSALGAHNAFMGSKSHKENMLKAYWEEVGIGVVRKPGTQIYYVVEIFVK
ncbi:MAG TPA: hypothetical protein GX512_07005 [Firmicutes bacterium]|nr:hypothetical protein [Candidatus Fermentithermobacillaceae bacterium]